MTGEAAAAAVVGSNDATTAVLTTTGTAEPESEDDCDVCCCWLVVAVSGGLSKPGHGLILVAVYSAVLDVDLEHFMTNTARSTSLVRLLRQRPVVALRHDG